MDMLVGAVGALGVALLIVGQVTWTLRGREFSALCRQIDDLSRKLAESEVRVNLQQEKMSEAETSLAAANTRLEALTKLEQELIHERKSVSDLNREIVRLRTQAKAEADAHETQISSLSAMRTEIAQKFGAVADEVLKASAKDIVNLAGHSMEAQRQATGSEIASLLAPIGASLAKYESTLTNLDDPRHQRQERWAEIATIGKDLHAQLRTVGGHVRGLGSHLDRLVREFNDMIGGLEERVLPQAQRLNELTVQGTSDLRVREFNELFGSVDGSAKVQLLEDLTTQDSPEPTVNLKPVDTVVRFPVPASDLARREMHESQLSPAGEAVAAD